MYNVNRKAAMRKTKIEADQHGGWMMTEVDETKYRHRDESPLNLINTETLGVNPLRVPDSHL